MFRIQVISGPDAGKVAVVTGPVVRVGRGLANDFALTDAMVSQQHGELISTEAGVLRYRDLCSRHGTRVMHDAGGTTLHNRDTVTEVVVHAPLELGLGESLLRVEHEQGRPRHVQSVGSREVTVGMPGLAEPVYKRTNMDVDEVTRRLSREDPRLTALFALARNLHSVEAQDEVLEMLAQQTFQAFPAANFFAVSAPADAEDEAMEPLITRTRGPGEHDRPGLLSQSLLRTVYERREAVLFVRDELGLQPTQSIVNARITSSIAAPLVGRHKLLGVIQVDTRGVGGLFGPDDVDLFTVLAGYAAFALERIELTRNILDMFEAVVAMSVNATDARDPATAGHSARVAELTLRLAQRVDAATTGPFATASFDAQQLRELRYAALLHDVGKIAVRERVLMKPTRLHPEVCALVMQRLRTARLAARLDATDGGPSPEAEATLHERIERIDRLEGLIHRYQPGIPMAPEDAEKLRALGAIVFRDADGVERTLLEPAELDDLLIPRGTLNTAEWEDMKAHVVHSESLLRTIPWGDGLRRVPDFAALHHEKLDGSGYPYGLSGDAIPLEVRMLTLADIHDALTSADRPYRPAGGKGWAMDVITQMAESGLLDRDLVDILRSEICPEQSNRTE